MRFRWDAFTFDVPSRRLRGPEGDIHLEPQVFDVLAYLLDHRDRVVPKEELLDNVWGDQFVSESALTSRIKSVRKALGDDGRTQKYVRNVPGRGYQFVGDATGEGATAAPVAAPDGRPRPRLALSIAVDDEYTFVGRDTELASMLDPILAGRSSSVFIGAAPGVGKSRLAVEVLERAAEAGVIVGAGRCDEYVASALQPIRDVIAQIGAGHPEAFPAWCRGVESTVVALVPSLTDVLDAAPVATDTYSGLEALLTILDRASSAAPVLVLTDDLQWSDEPTRAFLSRLHRRFGDRAITSIATHRSGASDLPGEVRHWISDQGRRENATVMDLPELGDDAGRALVRSVVGDDIDVDALIDQAGGNSLFITESLRDLQGGGTGASSVAMSVTARLQRLPDQVQQIVQAGAVLGPEFPFAVAAEAAELDGAAALTAVDAAMDAGLLHETASADRFRFSHQLVPESIRAELSRSALALVHGRCATALEAAGADEAEVAVHLLGAVPLVPVDEAVARSRDAATRAIDAKQYDRAVRLLDRCLDIGVDPRDRAEILLVIGWAIVASGRSEAAVPRFEEAADLGRRNGWVDVLVDAALGHFGRSPFRKPGDTRTLELLAEATAALDAREPGPSIAKARLLAKTAAFSVFTTRLAQRNRMTERALAMAPDADIFDRMELLESRSIAFACAAGIDVIEVVDAELSELRLETNTYFSDAAAPETSLMMRGDGAAMRRVTEMDEARRRAQPITEWRDLVLRGTWATFSGDFGEARRMYDDAAAIGEPYWGDSTHALHAFGHVLVAALDGDWDRPIELFELLTAFNDTQVFVPPLVWAHAAAGDTDRAREVLESLRLSSLGWMGEHIVGGNALIAAGEAALLLDDSSLAEAAEQRLVPYEDLVLGVPWAPTLAAADTLSRLAARRGDTTAADRHRTRAAELYRTLEAPALLARIS